MSKKNVNMKCLPADYTHRIGYLYDENAEGIYNGHPYKGIVIAIMGYNGKHSDDCSFDAIDDMVGRDMRTLDGSLPHVNGMYGETQYYMNSTYKGVAYCSKDDEFDLKEGMRVAREKMMKKYYKDKFRVAKIRMREVQKLYKQCVKYLVDINKKFEHYQ